MASIRQYQRRAIEAFVKEPEAFSIPGDLIGSELVTAEGSRLFVYGISEGVGSCSDIRAMDVLVVGEYEPNEEQQAVIAGRLAAAECAYTVEYLPRSRTTLEECKDSPYHPATYICEKVGFIGLAGVELLKPLGFTRASDNDVIVFERTGKKQLYVPVFS